MTEYGSHVVTGPALEQPGMYGSDGEHGPGWVTLLARDYAWSRRADIINRGFGGYNTRFVLEDLMAREILPPDRMSVVAVTVLLGTNDHAKPGHLLHVPVDEYESNLARILDILAIELPNAATLLLTPPPVDADTWRQHSLRTSGGVDDGGSLGNERLEPYVEACRRAARCQTGSQLVDLHEGVRAASPENWPEFLWDGLHLTTKGNAVVHSLVSLGLAKSKCAPMDLPVHRPHWLSRGPVQPQSRADT